MSLSRRTLIAASLCAPSAAIALSNRSASTTALSAPDAFALSDTCYLDSGSTHPVRLAAKAEVDSYLAHRTGAPSAAGYDLDEDSARAKFARLVGASTNEVAYVQSTTAGEQQILRALGLPREGAHIITDTLHFFGSFPFYEELARQGCRVTWLRPKNGRVTTQDIAEAMTPQTRLIALSAVSTFNGYQHDLQGVCRVAHAGGAMVYADIIHAAGCVPLDLHASGVDFAACASYKWLMGDFGLGFAYARADRQAGLLRTQSGYYGIDTFQSHVYPLDPPGREVADFTFFNDAMGHFAYGTYSHMGVAMLGSSLDYILSLGVQRIQDHAQALMRPLRAGLLRQGFMVDTPPDCTAPMITCILPDARKRLRDRMQQAKIHMTLGANRFRISLSVFNDERDIGRVLDALRQA